jgi:lipopolysaccharide biosynthesis glycosyltransferase
MKKNLIVTLANNNYFFQAQQLFSSIYWNSGWEGDYMLLTSGMSEKKTKWLREKGILVKKINSPVFYKELSGNSLFFFIILCLFTEEFKKWKTVIYLDADIIVKASLKELSETKSFTAAPDILNNKLAHQFSRTYVKNSKASIIKRVKASNQKHSALLNKLKEKYSFREPIFNAGVFTFNTEMIKNDTFSKLIEIFNRYAEIITPQGVLNLFFYKKWTKLPPVYNVYPYYWHYYYNLELDQIKGIVFHYAGDNTWGKPWNKSNPYYNEWKQNLEKADKIDLSKSWSTSKKWSQGEIEKYSEFIKRKHNIFLIKRRVDRFQGMLGNFLKKRFPRLYLYLLKRNLVYNIFKNLN